MSTILPPDIAEEILGRFHESRRSTLKLDLVNGRPGFWNWDSSTFIECGQSIADMRREMRNPTPHFPEDALGLGLLN